MTRKGGGKKDPENKGAARGDRTKDTKLSPRRRNAKARARDSKAAPKTKSPTTLYQYFKAPGVEAESLAVSLAAKKLPNPTKTDQNRTLAALPKLDPTLARVRELACAASAPGLDLVLSGLEGFLLASVQPRLEGVKVLQNDTSREASDSFLASLDALGPPGLKARSDVQLANALVVVVLVLEGNRGLEIAEAAPSLARSLEISGDYASTTVPSRAGFARLLSRDSLDLDDLRAWSSVSETWQRRIDELMAELERERASSSELRSESQGLRNDLRRSQDQTTRLEGDLREAILKVQNLEALVGEKEQVLQGTHHAKQLEGSQFRSSMAGFLQDDLLELVGTISEGLSLDPPRVPFALERIDDLDHLLREKLKWLTSSG